MDFPYGSTNAIKKTYESRFIVIDRKWIFFCYLKHEKSEKKRVVEKIFQNELFRNETGSF